MLPHVPYDEDKRRRALERIRERERLHARVAPPRWSELLIMKVEYVPELRSLRLRERIEALLGGMREELGGDFLRGTHIRVAYPVRWNLFSQTYRMNFSR